MKSLVFLLIFSLSSALIAQVIIEEDFFPHGDEHFLADWNVYKESSSFAEFGARTDGRLRLYSQGSNDSITISSRELVGCEKFDLHIDVEQCLAQSIFQIWLFRPIVNGELGNSGYKIKWVQMPQGTDYFMINKVVNGNESLLAMGTNGNGSNCLEDNSEIRLSCEVEVSGDTVELKFYACEKTSIIAGNDQILRAQAVDSSGDFLELNGLSLKLEGSSFDAYIDDIVIEDDKPSDCEEVVAIDGIPIGDINNDCIVNLIDIFTLAQSWLMCAQPGEALCEGYGGFEDDYDQDYLIKWRPLDINNVAVSGVSSTLEIKHQSDSLQSWINFDTRDQYDFQDKNFNLTFDAKLASGAAQALYFNLFPSGSIGDSQWAIDHPSHANQGYPESGYSILWYCDGTYSAISLVDNITGTVIAKTDNIQSQGLTFGNWYTFDIATYQTSSSHNFEIEVTAKSTPSLSWNLNATTDALLDLNSDGGLQVYSRKYGNDSETAAYIDNVAVQPIKFLLQEDFSSTKVNDKFELISSQGAGVLVEDSIFKVVQETEQSWATLATKADYAFEDRRYSISYDVKFSGGGAQAIYTSLFPSAGIGSEAWAIANPNYANQGYPETGYLISWYCDGSYSGVSIFHAPTFTKIASTENLYASGLKDGGWYNFAIDADRDDNGVYIDIEVKDKTSGNTWDLSAVIDQSVPEYIDNGNGFQVYSRRYGGQNDITTWFDNVDVRMLPCSSCSDVIKWSSGFAEDINKDCHVDIMDFGTFVESWDECVDPDSFTISPAAIDKSYFRINPAISQCLKGDMDLLRVNINGQEYDLPKENFNSVWDYSILESGENVVEAEIINSLGSVLARTNGTIFKIPDTQINNDLSTLDASGYFPDLVLGEMNLDVAKSVFEFQNGVLPTQITTDGFELLANPITLSFDGELASYTTTNYYQQKNVVSVASFGKINDYDLVVASQIYYDGFTWYTVDITGDQMSYGPLEIAIPIKIQGDDFILNHGPLYFDRLFSSYGVTNIGSPTDIKTFEYDSEVLAYSTAVPKADLPITLPLSCYVAIATDESENYRGIGVAIEGPKGWNIKDYDNVYEITQKSLDTIELKLKISDGLTRFDADEIHFSFGIQPFPSRVYNDNYNLTQRYNNCTLLDYYENERADTGITNAQYWVENGMTTALLFQDWTEYQNYFETWINEQDILEASTSLHEAGANLICYYGFEMSNVTPEFETYHDICLRQPSDYPEGGYQRGEGPTPSDIEQRAWPVCFKSLWGDYLFSGIKDSIIKYNLDGIYMDGSLYPAGCANQKHGCGVVDLYGRLIVTFDILQRRKYSEILHNYRNELGKNLILYMHVPAPIPPTMSFLDCYLTGETAHLYDSQSRATVGMLRGMYNGALYGIPCRTCLRPPYKSEQTFAQSLLVDSFIEFNAGGSVEWVEDTLKIWDIFTDYQLTRNDFVSFFNSLNKISKDNNNVLISYYDKTNVLVLIASNYYNDIAENVTLDLSNLNYSFEANAVDVWNDQVISFSDNILSMAIPPESMNILVLNKIN